MSPLRREAVDVRFDLEDGLQPAWDEGRIATMVRSIVERELPAGGRYLITLHLVGDEELDRQAEAATSRGCDGLGRVSPLGGYGMRGW